MQSRFDNSYGFNEFTIQISDGFEEFDDLYGFDEFDEFFELIARIQEKIEIGERVRGRERERERERENLI